MKNDTLLWVLGGLAAYYFFTQAYPSQPSATFQTCKYPDGTLIQVPFGNACPLNPAHGGQSQPCLVGSGPLQPGQTYC